MSGEGRAELEAVFALARAENRALLLPYLTAGLPTLDDSVELFVAMADAGADGFEVGIPYADPLMDGPVIMRAGELALEGGITVEGSLEVVRRVRERTGKPILVMTYVNPVLRHGIDAFFDRVADAGGSGVIIADLPVDESGPFVDAAAMRGLGMVQFAAPTTDHDRLAAIAGRDPVFVYAIAEVGVTGERHGASTRIEGLASAIRGVTQAPIVFGVGIATPDQAAAAARVGDGVIVGTAIVRRVLESESVDDARRALVDAVEALAISVRRE